MGSKFVVRGHYSGSRVRKIKTVLVNVRIREVKRENKFKVNVGRSKVMRGSTSEIHELLRIRLNGEDSEK